MRLASYACAALLIAASMSSSASAATDQSQFNVLPAPAVQTSADDSKDLKVAGNFGAGLATGIVGTLIIGGIVKGRAHDYRYRHYRSRYRGDRCDYWSRRCVDNWGYGGANYRGCLRYHGCY